MNKCIKCTDDYCYFANMRDSPLDSIDDLLRCKFAYDEDAYKQDLVISVYTKQVIDASECCAFDVEFELWKSDRQTEEEYRLELDEYQAFSNLSEEKQQELQSLIYDFLDKHVKTGLYLQDDFVGYIVLTKDILNDGKPIDGREFQIHKTVPSNYNQPKAGFYI